MTYLLFVDESGHDGRDSPYEVLAGAAVHDSKIWNLICDIHDAEELYFGMRRSAADQEELKARALLKKKTFRLAAQMPLFPPQDRRRLTAELLRAPDQATRARLTALGQAKIAFVERVLELCAAYDVRFFASVSPARAPRPAGPMLRKDYAFLFERFYYFIEDQGPSERGLVIFDELDRSQSHLLTGQMAWYFRETFTGRTRSVRIIPEPFFVHSDLTTGVQIADLVAYLIAWNVRFTARMTAARRPELDGLGWRVSQLRHRTMREDWGERHAVWSFNYIQDLRPRMERLLEPD